MKALLQRPQHDTYLKHRRQMAGQIILPVVLAGLLIVGLAVLIGLATFRGDGDVGRWSAISTIWLIVPVMIAGLIFLALLGGLIYLLARLMGILPSYTVQGQDFVYRLSGYVRRFTDASVKPLFAINRIGAAVQFILGRK